MWSTICSLSVARTHFILCDGTLRSMERPGHYMDLGFWNTASVHGFRIYRLFQKFVATTKASYEDMNAAYAAMSCWITFRSKTRVPPGWEDRYPDGLDQEEKEVPNTPWFLEHPDVVEMLVEEAEKVSRKREDIPVQRVQGPRLVGGKIKKRGRDVAEVVRSDGATSVVRTSPADVDGAVQSRKSSLKRRRDEDAPPTAPKRVKLEDHVTISSEYSSLVPDSFEETQCPEDAAQRQTILNMNRESTTEKHGRNAFARSCRSWTRFNRAEPEYVRGRWASPWGLEKEHNSERSEREGLSSVNEYLRRRGIDGRGVEKKSG